VTTNFQINGTDFDDLFVRKDLFTEGGLWSWGGNLFGQLGDNTTTGKSSPVQTVSGGTNWRQIDADSAGLNTAAIKTDGSLWLWGYNVSGQLGDNTRATKSSPIQTVAGGTNWKQVSLGSEHCAAIKTDGSLWMWGKNTNGNLGDNTTLSKSSPIQTISGGFNWKQVGAGRDFTAAIKTDGTLWLWGNNTRGQLGDNAVVNRLSPVQTIAGGTNWKQVSCGAEFAAAIKTDGTLWLWGANAGGQVGNNTRTLVSSPVQTTAGGTNWKQVSLGGEYSAAIKTDGTLWVWGSNSFGELGDNTINPKSTPVQTVAGGTNWKQVSGGGNFTAAIKTDGTLWLWGRNVNGQLGDGTSGLLTGKSSPVQLLSGGAGWSSVAAGQDHTVAVQENFW
jgi:alpha-tubulin suppressor-like RCC1 family protein